MIQCTHLDFSDWLHMSHIFKKKPVLLWLLEVDSSCEGTLQLQHCVVAPIGVGAAYPHSYCKLK